MPNVEGRRTFLAGSSLLRFQIVLLIVSAAMYVLQRALHSRVLLSSTLVDTFVAGNVSILLILAARPLFARRSRPWNWIVYIGVLVGVAFVANAALLPSYFLFAPAGVPLKHVIFENSPFTLLVTFIVGAMLYVFDDSRSQLEGNDFEKRKPQSQVQLGLSDNHARQSDLEQGHEIQMHLLPRETLQLAGFQIACAWQPARSVSGDYFDVLPLGEGKLGLCIADVSGKGVAAALLMANLQASVKALAGESLSPASLCSQLNTVLCDHIAPGRFVTMLYAVLDERSRVLLYESAGHCLPLLVHKDGAIEIPEASSGVLGLFSHWTYSDHELQLASGDVMVMLTDGVLEAWNAKEEEFGYKRLIGSVLASRQDGAHGIRKRVLEDVAAFCNGQFQDDASLIVVTVD
jgi:phosphoserine phosphatase RsbU/P